MYFIWRLNFNDLYLPKIRNREKPDKHKHKIRLNGKRKTFIRVEDKNRNNRIV